MVAPAIAYEGATLKAFSTDSNTTLTTGSIALATGSLVAVVFGGIINNPATPLTLTVSDSFAGVGAWTEVEAPLGDIYGYDHILGIAYAEVVSGGSGTITITRSPTGSYEWGGWIAVYELTHGDGVPVVRQYDATTQAQAGGGAGTSITVSLPSPIGTDGVTISSAIDQFGVFTNPAGITQDLETSSPGPGVRTFRDTTDVAQSLTWTNLGDELDIAIIMEFGPPEVSTPTDWERTGTFAFTLDFDADGALAYRRTGSFAFDMAFAATGQREVPRTGAFDIALAFAADGVVDHLRTGSFAFGLDFSASSSVRTGSAPGEFGDPRDTFDDRRGLRGRRERNWTAEPG